MLIALGSNVASSRGEPVETLRAALAALGESGLAVARASRIYASPAFPAGSGPDYANAVARIDPAGRSPEAVLALLHAVEAAFDRRREARWGPRTLDLDLLAAGAEVRPDPAGWRAWRELDLAAQRARAPDRLILPHPRIEDRAFVLVPLAEVAPGWRHPLTGATVEAMLAARPAAERAAIRPLDVANAADSALVKPSRGA